MPSSAVFYRFRGSYDEPESMVQISHDANKLWLNEVMKQHETRDSTQQWFVYC